MKLSRLAPAALATLAALMLASCAADAGNGDTDNGSSGVNKDAPLYAQLPDEIKEAGQITMAGDTHPPYRTIEADGSFTGIDPDLQAALSKELGVPFVIEEASGLDSMLTGMLSGRYDAFNGPVRSTEEREQQFDSIVWMTTRTSYVYLADREDELSKPEAVCGARVAGVTGSVTETQLGHYTEWCVDQGLDAPTFVGLADSNATFLAVNSDRADFAATTQGGAIDLMTAKPDKYGYLVQSDEQGAGVDLLAMFLPKDSGLVEPMFEAFQALFDNGEYERILSEWNISDVAVDKPMLNPLTSE
ncbi:transporter substrate-binding domain-containing protein [Paramicrobacterium fandaimingii]|uniref:transporter substrate-binding domain-containing protein n=1 Tax=Paramicrobacterium fandaimingii TaxID=2708079 RepID=UPI001420B0F0|nr:transporter substrate-binding domain-containing protein [Microbacterium fandaimingii]